MATDPMHPEQVVHDYVAGINGDSSKINALAESVNVYNPALSDGVVHDRAAYDSYIQDLRTGLPDFHFTEYMTVSKDEVVVVEFTITGTHDGELAIQRRGRIPHAGELLT